MTLRLAAALPWLTIACAQGLPSVTADAPKPFYLRTIERYPSPILKDLTAREYKFLLDPTVLPKVSEAAFQEIWRRIRIASERTGFTLTEGVRKSGKPAKVEASVKAYLDTAGQELWKKGYLLRITTKVKGEVETRSMTVKALRADAVQTLATPLQVRGAESRTEAEGNTGVVPEGGLAEYVEKGCSWTVTKAQLGSLTLADFGKFMPELLLQGIPSSAELVTTKVHARHVKPGLLLLPNGASAPFTLEAWSRSEGGPPFLYEISFRCEGVDFYQDSGASAAGERFMREVLQGELKDLALPGGGRWGGSKVRALLNRPVTE